MSFQRSGVDSVAVAILIALLGAHPAEAAFPGANGKILFDTNRDGGFEIYVTNRDGTALANITNHPANDQFAAWSPCGTKIAFSSDRDGPGTSIYVANADGTGVDSPPATRQEPATSSMPSSRRPGLT
jgi:TolB protein